MTRPLSIARFEQCYLGALLVGAINSALHWSQTANMPQVRQTAASFGPAFLPTVTAIGFLIPLLLWYFTAWRASVVAKWTIVVFFGFGVLGLFMNVVMGSFPTSTGAVLGIAALVLNGIAVWMLFKPDSKLWFGEDDAYADDADADEAEPFR